MIRDLVGQQAVDMHEAVLGTITEQYVENGITWVVINEEFEIMAAQGNHACCAEIIDLDGRARERNSALQPAYIRFENEKAEQTIERAKPRG